MGCSAGLDPGVGVLELGVMEIESECAGCLAVSCFVLYTGNVVCSGCTTKGFAKANTIADNKKRSYFIVCGGNRYWRKDSVDHLNWAGLSDQQPAFFHRCIVKLV